MCHKITLKLAKLKQFYLFTLTTVLSTSVFSVVNGDCRQSSFESVKVRVCATQCINELLVRQCVSPSTVFRDAETVEITGEAKIFRRGAVADLPKLRYISAFPVNLTRISPGAFLNLTSLHEVKLVFNSIEEIQWGVFSDSSVSIIDLSWNTIGLIENEAFSNMPNLKSVNLIRNQLTEYRQTWFTGSPSLETLLLGYNKIEKIDFFAFSIFPNLSYCDLSFNRIKQIGASAFDNVKHLRTLDLASNRLSWLQLDMFSSPIAVDELRVSLNRLSFISPTYLDKANVKSLFLHPNPWQCPCLDDILGWIRRHNATLRQTVDDHRIQWHPEFPECSFLPTDPRKCVIGYDDDYLQAQEAFFEAVSYNESVWEKPTSERPNFGILQVAKPFSEDLTPIN